MEGRGIDMTESMQRFYEATRVAPGERLPLQRPQKAMVEEEGGRQHVLVIGVSTRLDPEEWPNHLWLAYQGTTLVGQGPTVKAALVVAQQHFELKQRRTEMRAQATATAGIKTATKAAPAPRRGAITMLREMVLENHQAKLTDQQIYEKVHAAYPDKVVKLTDPQWMRSDIRRKSSELKLSLAEIEKRARRFNDAGEDITGQRKQRIAKAPTTPAPVKGKAVKKAPAPTPAASAKPKAEKKAAKKAARKAAK